MNSEILLTKFQRLPASLQKQAMDYIEFLISKYILKKTKRHLKSTEEELDSDAEICAVIDTSEDFLTKEELNYYLNLKDEF